MSQQPKTETDRLANVIQVLQLGHKTGRLLVERDNGPYFEQGIITFVNGQVVQAGLNQSQGLEAFDQMKNWGACRFSFTLEQNPGTISRMPTLSPPAPTGPSVPTAIWRATHPRSLPTSPLRSANTSPLRNAGTSPLRNRSSGALPQPGPMYPQEGIFQRTTRNLGGARLPTPTAWLATPYRTRHMEEGIHLIERMGLSRTHRRLFLLIDGNRTVKELIRLMSHNPDDVLKLLQDLVRTGVIQI